MNLKSVAEVPPGTKLVLRLDTDLPMEDGQILDNSRLVKSLVTIRELLNKKCKMVVIGYLGRPIGRDENFSMKPVYLELMSLLENDGQDWVNSVFVDDVNDTVLIDQSLANNEIVFLENLRFWPEENENNPEFLKNLTELCSCVVMDAFAVAHRNQTSVTMHRKMPVFYGYDFIREVEGIGKINQNPKRPMTVILGGKKEDKLDYLEGLLKIADWVLVGGKFSRSVEADNFIEGREKLVIAKLREDGADLAEEDIEIFKKKIGESQTVIWVGPVGKYEEAGSRRGTEEIAKAVVDSGAYKVAAGGDTAAGLESLGLIDKIDLISCGGGAMLTLLTKGTLPAWE